MRKKIFQLLILAFIFGGLLGLTRTALSPVNFQSTKIAQVLAAETNNGNGEFFGPTLNEYLQNFYIWSIGVAGLLAIVMLMYAGYGYATSEGNPEHINQSKEIIVGALSGLVLLIVAAIVAESFGLGMQP